ncbi:two-pore potassium channel 3-like [Gastrolobium bilobum]|uniref:two-pore potassium channel 3-like n=1 Tax=Gastrolobium bilobum TaxID=150636 RepID=UPI002AB2A115|nr:two-pore potassium channel 3-like [Gastrolobium bilobum]
MAHQAQEIQLARDLVGQGQADGNENPNVAAEVGNANRVSVVMVSLDDTGPCIRLIWSIGALMLYIAIGLSVYLTSHNFNRSYTKHFVDGIYFIMVTLSTNGYGDITPKNTSMKVFTSFYTLLGFWIYGPLVEKTMEYICYKLEAALCRIIQKYKCLLIFICMVDIHEVRFRTRFRICMALGIIILWIAIGLIGVHYFEHKNLVDSFYLTMVSISTVGYGDLSFQTLNGRCFAFIWLFGCILIVRRTFNYLIGSGIDWLTTNTRRITIPRQVLEADIDMDKSICKAEFILQILKQRGSVTTEQNIQEISQIFNSLDSRNGKLSLEALAAYLAAQPRDV